MSNAAIQQNNKFNMQARMDVTEVLAVPRREDGEAKNMYPVNSQFTTYCLNTRSQTNALFRVNDEYLETPKSNESRYQKPGTKVEGLKFRLCAHCYPQRPSHYLPVELVGHTV